MFKIPNLNSLTIPYLKKIAEECDIVLNKGKKADIIRIISNSNISKDIIDNLVKKYLKEKQSIGADKKKKRDHNYLVLEQKFYQLEKKVDFLYSIIKQKYKIFPEEQIQLENNLKEDNFKISEDIDPSIKKIKDLILEILKPRDSITIDNLIQIKELQDISLSQLKKAIKDLIEMNILYATNGKSIQKIDGNIGKLIRIH
ncbi:MAG: hypothetical protein JXA99_03550 [Candidatus Lokiarchaeota archaeon]|nr:hypothetical protein [Candidatus Lokiarchaeota archaeon]